MRLKCQTLAVLCYAVLVTADQEYDNKLTKLWSMSSASNSDGSAVLNVTSASIVIPSSYNSDPVIARTSRASQNFKPYVFRPRAIPLKTIEKPQEKSVYYAQDNKYKTEILLPGNYFAIPKEKSIDDTQRSAYNPSRSEPFEPKSIPLLRGQGFEKRSLDVNMEPIVENSDENSEHEASRRSLSCKFTKYSYFYILFYSLSILINVIVLFPTSYVRDFAHVKFNKIVIVHFEVIK